jgi:hypothetical protein
MVVSVGGLYTTGHRLQHRTLTTVYDRGVSSETTGQVRLRFAAEPARWSDVNIFWCGRNNISSVVFKDADIIPDLLAMTTSLEHDRWMVLSILPRATDTLGSAVRDRVLAKNEQMSETFGVRFVPLERLLFSGDLIRVALRAGGTHLNDCGYTAVAEQITQHGAALGFFRAI